MSDSSALTKKGVLDRSSLGVRRSEMKGRGKGLVVKRECRLDQARHARGSVQVTDVGLHRTEGAVARLLGPHPERPGEPGDLDGVSQRGAGAVRLDVGDRVGVDARHGLGHRDGVRLAVHARGGEADAARPVVVHRRALDDRVDRVAVVERFVQPLQHHDAEAVGEDGSRRPLVKGPAMTVGRGDEPLLVQVSALLREPDRNAPGQRDIALVHRESLRRPDTPPPGTTNRRSRR